MSLQALRTGAAGLTAFSDSLGVVANNLANLQTPGFKGARASFQDLMYRSLGNGSGTGGAGVGVSIGTGSAIAATQTDFAAGTPESTGNPLDLAINGQGFFAVADGAGNTFFSRAGNLTLDANGQLSLPTGSGNLTVQPPISVPAGASDISVSADGTVSAVVNGQPQTLGQLEAVTFVNPEGLTQAGNNLFAESGASGSPQVGTFGTAGVGSIQQGALEGSNVDFTASVVDLLTNQQGFNFNAEVVRAANQNLQTLQNILR